MLTPRKPQLMLHASLLDPVLCSVVFARKLCHPSFWETARKTGGDCGPEGRHCSRPTDKQTDSLTRQTDWSLSNLPPPFHARKPRPRTISNQQRTMDLQLAVIVNRCMEAHPLPRGPRWIPLNPDPGFLNVAFLFSPRSLATLPLSPRYVPKARAPMPRSRPMGRGQRPALARSQSRGGPPQPPRQSSPGRSSSQLLMAIAVAVRSLMPDFADQPARDAGPLAAARRA